VVLIFQRVQKVAAAVFRSGLLGQPSIIDTGTGSAW